MILIVGTGFSVFGDVITQGEYLNGYLLEQGVNARLVSRYPKYVKRTLDTLYNLFQLRKNDMIIIQVYGSKSIWLEWLSANIGKFKKVRVISTLHGGAIPDMHRKSFVKRFLLRDIFRKSDLVTAPSLFMVKELNLKFLEEKFTVIPNFIEINEYSAKEHYDHAFNLFWMRAYQKMYDPIKALEVVRLLLKKGKKVKLHMAGPDQGLYPKVSDYVKKHKLSNEVTLYGKIDTPEKNRLAKICSLFLNTSRIDNCPVTFLEMMALGLPIVTTNVGGIPYWVDDKNAAISQDNSAEDIARRIDVLLSDKNSYHKMVDHNLEYVRNFSRENIGQQWLQVIAKLNGSALN